MLVAQAFQPCDHCVVCLFDSFRVYFTAQASHLEHLARKFEESVDKAMGLSVPERHKLQAAALARRFPVTDMMQQYADAWVQVRGCKQPTLVPCGKGCRTKSEAHL